MKLRTEKDDRAIVRKYVLQRSIDWITIDNKFWKLNSTRYFLENSIYSRNCTANGREEFIYKIYIRTKFRIYIYISSLLEKKLME